MVGPGSSISIALTSPHSVQIKVRNSGSAPSFGAHIKSALFLRFPTLRACHIQNLANRHRGVSPSGRGVERCVGHGVRTSTLSASPLVFPSGRVGVSFFYVVPVKKD